MKKYIKKIIITLLASIVLLTGCTKNQINTTKPVEITIPPSSSNQMFSEDLYINYLKGDRSVKPDSKENIQTEYIIRPCLADYQPSTIISQSALGYSYGFRSTDEKHEHDMIVSVSDKKHEESIDLYDAMLESYGKIDKNEMTHVNDGVFEHYIQVKKILGANANCHVYLLYV